MSNYITIPGFGARVSVRHPSQMTDEGHKAMQELYWANVVHAYFHGPCVAQVPQDIVHDVAEAMAWNGDIPDAVTVTGSEGAFINVGNDEEGRSVLIEPIEGHYVIHSRGYHHHIGS